VFSIYSHRSARQTMRRCTPVRWAARHNSGPIRPAHLILRASLTPRSRLVRPSVQPIPCTGIEPTASGENALELVALRETLQPGAGDNRGACIGRALPARCARIALITTGSSMHAMMRIVQPQAVQISTSMPNTRFMRCAQRIEPTERDMCLTGALARFPQVRWNGPGAADTPSFRELSQ
jgi:hypothetical protein